MESDVLPLCFSLMEIIFSPYKLSKIVIGLKIDLFIKRHSAGSVELLQEHELKALLYISSWDQVRSRVPSFPELSNRHPTSSCNL